MKVIKKIILRGARRLSNPEMKLFVGGICLNEYCCLLHDICFNTGQFEGGDNSCDQAGFHYGSGLCSQGGWYWHMSCDC